MHILNLLYVVMPKPTAVKTGSVCESDYFLLIRMLFRILWFVNVGHLFSYCLPRYLDHLYKGTECLLYAV